MCRTFLRGPLVKPLPLRFHLLIPPVCVIALLILLGFVQHELFRDRTDELSRKLTLEYVDTADRLTRLAALRLRRGINHSIQVIDRQIYKYSAIIDSDNKPSPQMLSAMLREEHPRARWTVDYPRCGIPADIGGADSPTSYDCLRAKETGATVFRIFPPDSPGGELILSGVAWFPGTETYFRIMHSLSDTLATRRLLSIFASEGMLSRGMDVFLAEAAGDTVSLHVLLGSDEVLNDPPQKTVLLRALESGISESFRSPGTDRLTHHFLAPMEAVIRLPGNDISPLRLVYRLSVDTSAMSQAFRSTVNGQILAIITAGILLALGYFLVRRQLVAGVSEFTESIREGAPAKLNPFLSRIAEINELGEIYNQNLRLIEEKEADLLHSNSELSQYINKLEISRAALYRNEERYRLIAENVSDIVWTSTLDFKLTYVSPSVEDALGYTPEEILRSPGHTLLDAESYQEALHLLSNRLRLPPSPKDSERKPVVHEKTFVHKSGEEKIFETSNIFLRDENGTPVGILGISRDITHRKNTENALRESEQRYRDLAIRDELTGLFNSRYFFSRARAEIKRTTRYDHPLSLIFIDIDNFKEFNDRWGHMAGDSALMDFSRLLSDLVRTPDMAFRYGGEEFCILLPETEEAEARALGERIMREVSGLDLHPSESESAYCTISMGITQFRPGESLSSFVNRADANMYRAKAAGDSASLYSG